MTADSCTLAPEPASVQAARRHVQRRFDAWGLGDAAWPAGQLVSELATNAVLHARTEFTVEVSRAGDVVRVCVVDSSPAEPHLHRYAGDATTGRGLRLVDSIAHRWGVSSAGSGKTVWFELDISRPRTVTTWDDGVELDLDVLLAELGEDDAVSDLTRVRAARAAGPGCARRRAA